MPRIQRVVRYVSSYLEKCLFNNNKFSLKNRFFLYFLSQLFPVHACFHVSAFGNCSQNHLKSFEFFLLDLSRYFLLFHGMHPTILWMCFWYIYMSIKILFLFILRLKFCLSNKIFSIISILLILWMFHNLWKKFHYYSSCILYSFIS